MFPVAYVSVPLDMPEGRGAVVAFTDIEDRLRDERRLKEHDAVLATERESLRRVAGLVAGGAASENVFAGIAREVAQVLRAAMVQIWRYEADDTATVVGAWSDRPHPFQVGTNWPFDHPTIAAVVEQTRTGLAARVDDLGEVGGSIADSARGAGLHSGAVAPIVVDGEAWGMMGAGVAEGDPLPGGIVDRLAEFTELVATAISTTASREQLTRLADEQAALRRVATLVAQGVPPAELFAAVAAEVGGLLRADVTGMVRYEGDGTVAPTAVWTAAGEHPAVPDHWPLEEGDPAMLVAKTRRAVRIDDWHGVPGPISAYVRDELGISCSVGSPILVEGRLWGALAVHWKSAGALPPDTEARLENFTELVATAMSNVQARADLAASRARIVAATDEERRRVVRDLHDGAQHRMVQAALTLKMAQEAVDKGEEGASRLVTEAIGHTEQATAELRELAHGILPGVLTHGGLSAGVSALASRTPVPVESDVSVGRLPAAIEATAYFVVAEALTNVAKHSRAAGAEVTACVEEGSLRVSVRDDGVGGARLDGSGFVGLADRLEALDGRLHLESPAGGGTLVAAEIPLPG